MERLVGVINRFLAFRTEQEALLEGDNTKRLGDVTTVNLTMLEGGVQFNVVPAECSAGISFLSCFITWIVSKQETALYNINLMLMRFVPGFDMRVAPSVDLQGLKKMVDEFTAGEVNRALCFLLPLPIFP
jgi:aminoacylase